MFIARFRQGLWEAGHVCHPPGELGMRGKHEHVISHARGEVTVSTNEWVLLELKAETESQREVIRSLPHEGIRGLRVNGGTLDQKTIVSVSEMASLELLEFRRCTFVDDAFRNAPGLTKLVQLTALIDISDDAMGDMVRWMSDCPRLDYLYWMRRSSSSLPKHAWDRLGDHPSLGFVNVSIESDGAEVLRSLAKLNSVSNP